MLKPDMIFTAALSPLQASSRTAAPATATEWHSHLHDELCLVSDGTPIVGHASGTLCPEPGTLFLFMEGETHGFWNLGTVMAHLWSLEFRISSTLKAEFRELFERAPERRVLKLSAVQQQRFCSTCQKIAFEKDVAGFLN